MPLDPQMKAVLDRLAPVRASMVEKLGPLQARRTSPAQPPGEVEPVARVENRPIPGPGGEIPVRIYWPAGDGPFGALVYFHGGGWVAGGLDMTDQSCRLLTNKGNCVTVSVDYRLAPEHKFPAAIEDGYAALTWVAGHAADLNCDPARIAVGGASAGGNIAAALALMARDRKGPRLAYQLLVYPVTSSACDTPSHRQFANDSYYFLTSADAKWVWEQYLASDADRTNPYASPAHAKTLAGLPPAFVITAEYDPLRDEGEAYAARLREEGVPVAFKRYAGVTHAFFGMTAAIEKARIAVADAGAALRVAIG